MARAEELLQMLNSLPARLRPSADDFWSSPESLSVHRPLGELRSTCSNEICTYAWSYHISIYIDKRLDLWIPTLSKQMVLLDYKKRMDDDNAYDQPRPLTSGLCNCLNQIARIPKTLCHRSRQVPRCWRVPNVAPSAVGSHPWPPGGWKAPENRSHFGSFFGSSSHTHGFIYIYMI
jgi:hypothetical protein